MTVFSEGLVARINLKMKQMEKVCQPALSGVSSSSVHIGVSSMCSDSWSGHCTKKKKNKSHAAQGFFPLTSLTMAGEGRRAETES